MGLWSFFGLADAASIHALEIQLEELKQQQTDQLSAGIAEVQDATRQQGELLRSVIETLVINNGVSQERLEAIQQQLQALVNAQKQEQHQMKKRLDAMGATLEQVTQSLQILQKLESSLAGQDYALADITEQINKTISILADAQDSLKELPAVKSYLYELWEAMKLVWVNDLLDMAEQR